jgi:hypothetical protein
MFKSNPRKLMQSYFLFLGTIRNIPIAKKEENNHLTRDQGSTPNGHGILFFFLIFLQKTVERMCLLVSQSLPQKIK